MAEILLVGTENEGNENAPANYFSLYRFQAVASGNNVTKFKVYSGVSGNLKVAVYSDTDSAPDVRLGYNDSSQAVTGGQWNDLTISAIDIVSGINYWLATNVDTSGSLRRQSSGGTAGKYKSATFSTFTFPDPAGTGFSNSSKIGAHGVWGEEVGEGINPKVKVSGTFSTKTTSVKIGGTFAEKPVLVKVGGTFQ